MSLWISEQRDCQWRMGAPTVTCFPKNKIKQNVKHWPGRQDARQLVSQLCTLLAVWVWMLAHRQGIIFPSAKEGGGWEGPRPSEVPSVMATPSGSTQQGLGKQPCWQARRPHSTPLQREAPHHLTLTTQAGEGMPIPAAQRLKAKWGVVVKMWGSQSHAFSPSRLCLFLDVRSLGSNLRSLVWVSSAKWEC